MPHEQYTDGKDTGDNHSYLQPLAQLTNDVDHRGQIERHRQLATDHRLDLRLYFTEGGKPENPE